MQFTVHLFTGLLLGLIIFYFVRKRHLVVICAFGSVLPDLGDKTFWVLSSSGWISAGMINLHSFQFLLLSVSIAAAGWIIFRTHAFAVLSAGIALHHLLDRMWLQPRVWFETPVWPPSISLPADYPLRVLRSEFGSPRGLLLIIAAAVILLLLYGSSIRRAIRSARRYF
ncbi:MAG: hypothetical protein KO206_01145 [Methanomicrobiaceae archaeon]|nr:hypothetical protein [Methanomicrobiaceae archaeon]MDD5420324.1 metal-dependent hydrolase [Methanomicrobiaceae archaeon]